MNVEDRIQQVKSEFPNHIVDKEKFTESFWVKVEQLDKVQKSYSRRRRIAISTAVIVVASGAVFSPMIVSAVQKVPFVHVVSSWVKGSDSAPYVKTVQQSSTSHGVTMTITDVLYGPSQLSFGYIVTPGQSGFPHGGSIALGSPNGMEFFVNGKKAKLQAVGSDESTAYGFKGLVTLTDSGTKMSLPSTFNLQIELHKIGHQRGTWRFNVPVSRTNMTAEQTFLPMVTKQVGSQTITVKEVKLYPTGGMIDYDVTAPVGAKPSLNIALFNENKSILDTVFANTATAISHATHGGLEVWSYNQSFRIPGSKPTSLIIDPVTTVGLKPKSVPLTGPFPISVTSGVLGKLTITGADVKRNTVTVYYTSQHNPNQPAFGFSIADTTHPDERFGGTIGEHVGSSASDRYMNVYKFSSDVSLDKLELRLPPQTEDNVFDVPLRNH